MKEQLLKIKKLFYRIFSNKQSILVIATVRSGGTSLLNAIGDAYNQEVFFEPHTPMYKKDYNPYKSIVKNVIQNMSVEEHIELAKKFDKVVLFDRRDILEQSASYWHLWKKNDGRYKDDYKPNELYEGELYEVQEKFTEWKKDLQKIAKALDKPIIHFEDVQAFILLTASRGRPGMLDEPNIKVANFDPNIWYNPTWFLPYRKLRKGKSVREMLKGKSNFHGKRRKVKI